MNSETLNKKIYEIDDKDELSTSGGKCIPYIGWFWRNVDFDAKTYRFGILPGEFVGFMENNKWDYNYTRELTPKEWEKVKALLVDAVTNPTKKTTRVVWDYIQTFGVVG